MARQYLKRKLAERVGDQQESPTDWRINLRKGKSEPLVVRSGSEILRVQKKGTGWN